MYYVIVSYTGCFHHTLLSLVTTFITVLQNICYDYFPVPQMLYNPFLYGIIYWIFKKFQLEMGGGAQRGKSMYAMGVLASVHVRAMGGGRVKFLPFWCVRTN